MTSTRLPSACHSRRMRSTASGSLPAGGVRMHQRPSNRSAKPAAGPDCSVPATGWPGTKWTPSGNSMSSCRIAASLTEPTSVTTVPGARCGPMAAATSANAPMGVHRNTVSAPATAATQSRW